MDRWPPPKPDSHSPDGQGAGVRLCRDVLRSKWGPFHFWHVLPLQSCLSIMSGHSSQDGPFPRPVKPGTAFLTPPPTAPDSLTSRKQLLSAYSVLLGSISSYPQAEEPQELRAVAELIIHPEYLPETSRADIALVQLASPVTYSDLILPVCLPKPGDPLDHGTWCWVTGWGNIDLSIRKDARAGRSPIKGGHGVCTHWCARGRGEPRKYGHERGQVACHPRPSLRLPRLPSQHTAPQG